MRTWIKPPIVVDGSGDTDVFDSIEAAERYMEPIDVEEDNTLVAFDSVGRLLRLLPTSPRVTIEAAEEVPNHAERVREILIKFLKNCRSTESNLTNLTLAELAQKSLAYKTR